MTSREIIKKRVGPEGVEVACDADEAPWIDIKETKKTRYEQGKGFVYRKTIYKHENESDRREYDDEPEDKITFKNPDDEDQKIEYLKSKGANHGTIKWLWIEAGRGQHYQKTRLKFDNSVDNEIRKVREQRVENPETGDHIMVERIERFTVEWGKGQHYQGKRVVPTNDEETIEASEGECKEIQE